MPIPSNTHNTCSTSEARPKAVIVMEKALVDDVFGAPQREALAEHVDIIGVLTMEELNADLLILNEVTFLFTSWGVQALDASTLDSAPNLKAIFHAGGTVRSFVTNEIWERQITVTSASPANAIPVAEFCVSATIFSLKKAWQNIFRIREEKNWIKQDPVKPYSGTYQATVGFVSFGQTARKTRELLRSYSLKVRVWSPEMTDELAAEWNVIPSSLEELFKESDVVSLHAPQLPETEGMIDRDLLSSMKQGATLINTARGSVINQPELIEVFNERPDLFALLDVVHPEPPKPGAQILSIPNILITPHIAGSMGLERRRCGDQAIRECLLFLRGEPLEYTVTKDSIKLMA